MSAALQMPLFRPRRHAPAPESIDIHAVSLPARTFTGDFYFTRRTDDRLWFAVGDVAGKGLPAALVMAMIQEELEMRITSCSNAGCDPSTTMSRLHAFLRPLLPSNRFATAVIGWLRDDGTLRIVNAGHCPPLVVHRDGRIERIDSTGPIIGVLPSSRWTANELTLTRGESLVLFSDGVVESASPEGLEFGEENVTRIASRHARGGARAMAAAIVDGVNHFTGGVREDDLTLVVVTR
jgi:serine phosphatase RsbU (regulator of sigma subunit)